MMITNRHKQLFLICVLAGSVILTVSTENGKPVASAAALPDVIPIGFLAPLTGGLDWLGSDVQEGAELAEWVVNTKWGGIPRSGLTNATIDLLVRDTATTSTTAAAATTTLITTDGAEIIVGAAGSPQTLAAAAVTNPAQVVLLSYASTSPNITTQGGEYTFRVVGSDTLQGWALADLALGQGYRNATSLHVDNLHGRGLAAVFKEKFEAAGGKVVQEIPYVETAGSFATEIGIISGLEGAGSIDVIVDISYQADGAKIFTEAALQGITTPWVCADGVATDAIFGTAGVGAAMKGMWGTKYFLNTSTVEYQQFNDSFYEKYPTDTPGIYADYAYDAVMLAVDAIIAAGVYDGTTIKNALQGISQGWKGATGDKTFDAYGDVRQDFIFWNVTEPVANTFEFTTQGLWTRPVIVKWDSSVIHDIWPPYGGADQAFWNTTLDAYGATRVYTNESFNDAYFNDTTAAIIPLFNNGTNITQAEADAVKKFVDSGGQVLLSGYYHKWFWNWTGQNLIAGKFGVEFVVNEGPISNYTYTLDDVSNYDSYPDNAKVTNFEPHPITNGVTEWYARGPSLRVTNPDVKVLARGSPTAYYNSSVNSDWINGTDIIHLAVLENDKGGGILFSAGATILRHAYTTQHGIDHGYNGSKLVDNVAKWLVNGPDITSPRIDAPPNVQYNESGSEKITWYPTDAHPANYTIYRNGTIADSGPWSGGEVSFGTVSLSLGFYNCTLLVNDTSGNWAAFTVWVTIIDATVPTIDQPAAITHNEGTSGKLTWQPADAHPASYTLYRNSTVNASGIWTGGELSFALDYLSLGTYNFTLVVNDTTGHWTASTVWVTVRDATAPTIDQPRDITYDEGTSGHRITWQPTDSHPYWYNITRDGTLVADDPWTGSVISVNIEGLAVGTYTYTLVVYDQHGNSVSDTVLVTVTEGPPASSEPSKSESEPSRTSPGFTVSVLLLVGICFIIIRSRRR
ncbi:MAG: ABC transporter substrate-binding protein [Candidatus Heimdallarchaeota archaeon]